MGAIVAFYVIGVILSLGLNMLVAVVLISKKKDLNHLDLLMISLSVSDILQTLTGYPLEIYSFVHDTIISDLACTIAGFTTTFFALVSISHLVGIALERFVILKFPLKARVWMESTWISLYVIVPSWLYGLLWSVLPLLGWSSYTRENGVRNRCSVDMANDDPQARSYAYTLLITCYVVPVTMIGGFSCLIIKELKGMTKQAESLGLRDDVTDARRKLEKKYTYMVLALIVTFLIAWTPYTACVFVATIDGAVPAKLFSFSSIFAKTSTVYNPIIYSMFIKEFRDRAKRLFGIKPSQGEESIPMTSSTGASVTQGEDKKKP